MKCPTPDKIPFRSKVDAMARATSASDWYEKEMGVYRCRCRSFHLYTKAKSESASEPVSASSA